MLKQRKQRGETAVLHFSPTNWVNYPDKPPVVVRLRSLQKLQTNHHHTRGEHRNQAHAIEEQNHGDAVDNQVC
jgi:hypothetical protein